VRRPEGASRVGFSHDKASVAKNEDVASFIIGRQGQPEGDTNGKLWRLDAVLVVFYLCPRGREPVTSHDRIPEAAKS
jgi:hypothetical protein